MLSQVVNKTDDRLPLMEKYRPKTIAEIHEHSFVKKVLLRFLECGEMPHLLFYGPPGSGKTTALFALANELFGEYRNHMILELNSSDERGIMVIREKIKQFASTRNLMRPNYPKLIILDEADNMTYDAQFALRRIIELYTNNARFCFICNWENKIIDAIKSRCLVYRFNRLRTDTISGQMNHVMHVERMFRTMCDQDRLAISDCIGQTTDGDMRRAYNVLEYVRHCNADSPNIVLDHIYQNVYGATHTQMNEIAMFLRWEGSSDASDGSSGASDGSIDASAPTTDGAIGANAGAADPYRYSRDWMDTNTVGITTLIRILTQIGKSKHRWSFLIELATINYRFNMVNCSNENMFVRMICSSILSNHGN